MKYDVFLSYKRQKGSERAELLRAILMQNGYSVFMDTHELKSGHFIEVIKEAIAESESVIVLIYEGCFEKVQDNDTWVMEVAEALRLQKKIVPIYFDGIKTIEGLDLPKALLSLPSHNAISYVHEYADAAYTKLFSFLGEPCKQNTRLSLKKAKTARKKGKTKWPYLVIAAVLAIVSLTVFLVNGRGTFTYHNNGINVQRVSGLTTRQQNILTDILDNMQLVKGGCFLMGNYDRLEGEGLLTENDAFSAPQHKVTLSSFYISKYELTQEQWSAFLDLKPVTKHAGMSKPVDYLSWENCSDFVTLLSAKTGLAFALPTEAQWEFAARGGLSGAERELLYSGSDDPFVAGWIFVSPDSTSLHKVGLKTGNELGLFDMTGNVSEWCQDYFGSYTDMAETNPHGPSDGELRVIRGGDYMNSLRDCKVTSRQKWFPYINREATGMRLVINIEK